MRHGSESGSYFEDQEQKIGLAHKNLNQIYGRVRSQFNKKIRQGGASIKFKSKKHRGRQEKLFQDKPGVQFAYLDKTDP